MATVNLAIVGGGILGQMVAVCASIRGLGDVLVLDEPGDNNLKADSLRNHSWLQSGLLYPHLARSSAAQMFVSGRAMLDLLGLPVPKDRGIFRFPDSTAVADFKRAAQELRLLTQIRELDAPEAERRAGPFYGWPDPHRDWRYVEVPDTIVDEARILKEARRLGEQLGVHYRRSRTLVRREPSSPSGVVLEVDGNTVVPGHVILCGGSGTITLLNQLGLPHPLSVFRSALLDIGKGGFLGTPLLVDRSRETLTAGLAVAQHPRRRNLRLGSRFHLHPPSTLLREHGRYAFCRRRDQRSARPRCAR